MQAQALQFLKRIFTMLILTVLLLGSLYMAAATVSPALAGVSAEELLDSAIDWWVVASTGGVASGGEFAIHDTLGQPIAGASSNGDLSVQAGYWSGVAPEYPLYLPLIQR